MLILREDTYRGEVTEEMVEYVRKLVRAKFRVRPVPGMEVEDIEQAALEEVLKHIHKFDPDRAPLAGFLAIIARSVMCNSLKYVTAESRWNGEQPIAYEQAEVYGDEAVSYLERNYETIGFKLDLLIHSGVNDIERVVALLLYSGLSQREISRRLGFSRKKVRRIVTIVGQKYKAGTSFSKDGCAGAASAERSENKLNGQG